MRVDMVERVAFVVRNVAREGQFRINEEMLSLAGATREQMAAMLMDLNCKVVGEEPDEDPEKPPIQIFERIRRQRRPVASNGLAARKAANRGLPVTPTENRRASPAARAAGRSAGSRTGRRTSRRAASLIRIRCSPCWPGSS